MHRILSNGNWNKVILELCKQCNAPKELPTILSELGQVVCFVQRGKNGLHFFSELKWRVLGTVQSPYNKLQDKWILLPSKPSQSHIIVIQKRAPPRPVFSTCTLYWKYVVSQWRDCGSTVVKVLCYKSEGHWFDPSWCHCNFSLT